MELNELIRDLINSGIIENQELAVTILSSDEVDKETKRKHIDKFVKDYIEGRVNFHSEEQKHIFGGWVKIYQETIKGEVKKRVKGIE
jgi:hypothetical protein